MRYLLAPDSFKEAVDAVAVAKAMRRGVLAGDGAAETRMLPLSDGGEGLALALVSATHGMLRHARVHDALGYPIEAQYGFLGHDNPFGNVRTAVIELAAASGIERIPKARRDPMSASSFGTGELIMAAINAGAQRIILGLGGSASTDGGAGIATACGYRFLDKHGKPLEQGGGSLSQLHAIDAGHLNSTAASIPIVIASDVTNPLTGLHGAARVFAPQKGANAMQVDKLDSGLAQFSACIASFNGEDVRGIAGAGAAGGSGAGLLGLFNATIQSGIALVLDLVNGREACQWADLVITGEGSIDAQTPYGKVPSGIAKLAQTEGKPCIAIGGRIKLDTDDRKRLRDQGIVATFGITPGPADFESLLATTEENVETTCASIASLLKTHLCGASGA
ncbi:MAG: glycerate kinase [Bifidobacterium aquikefiri]|uniref:Glycerate kinase n=1 Tax=Bifidobacterium aquikefiri TaxID=1653207 RepID=A0A261G6Y9_9BIFI|nr:glycerate kinase [Bifidobacterium aquikefiri]OZG67191.1 glycerate kinase [Bifidobacterium aquikefiri]